MHAGHARHRGGAGRVVLGAGRNGSAEGERQQKEEGFGHVVHWGRPMSGGLEG
ncbi:hypothetical protein [Hymenobacter sp. BT491]|uniref:hypothetical protein n=1 Tax=Hymenobacter sp. BT491 TaxID=2766779 RepID=UPI001653B437|nr:hypothetical protein [Hymenobacter sp. BT491]